MKRATVLESRNGMPALSDVRRMEAVSFRSFPATSTFYDGTWLIRLTAGHPAKRLNSVNPLDPSDHSNIDARVEIAQHRFDSFGRDLVFRQSPLAPPELERVLDDRGWIRFEESIVMAADLSTSQMVQQFSNAIDHLPLQDHGVWVDAFLRLSDETPDHKPGLAEVIGSTQPKVGLFLSSNDDTRPLAAVRCVQDNELVGIFDLVANAKYRGEGFGRSILASSLRWAANSGAKTAWLQVVADNAAAIKLYESFGFRELYRYAYRAKR